MLRLHRCLILGLFGLLLGAVSLQARVLRTLTDQELLASSDVIAILEPLKNENNADQFEWIPQAAQGVSTTFKVLSVLKGDSIGQTLILKHFIYTKFVPANAGELINFLIGPLRITATYNRDGKVESFDFGQVTPRWLAYLKRMPDGTFAPVSGQVDPNFSFEELHKVTMYGTPYTADR